MTEIVDDGFRPMLDLLTEAHSASCHRSNPSTVAVEFARKAGTTPKVAFMDAIQTVDAAHAAVIPAYRLLDNVRCTLPEGIVPGFGNGFVKEGQDLIWQPVEDYFQDEQNPWYCKAARLEKKLKAKPGKGHLRMNPAMFTAITALSMDLPEAGALALFIHCRVIEWAQIFTHGRES